MDDRVPATRRRVLRTGGLLGAVGLAGCSSGRGSDGGGDGNGGSAGDDNGGSAGDDNGGSAGDDNGGSAGGSGGEDGGGSVPAATEEWLAAAPNYDGTVVDRTGEDRVPVVVGAGNGLVFDPPLVRVSTGTTVVWEWTGQGGQHNVREVDGAFESELASTAGFTFERTFDAPGVVRYLCVPHEALGMKGAVDVVDG
jgi:halocyanin-like protein